jgi:Outer membrane efflux protein
MRSARFISVLTLFLLVLALSSTSSAQKRSSKTAKKQQTQATTELARLRGEYVKATKDYKASLEKLLPLYKNNQANAEKRFAQSQELFKQGLIAKKELDDAEHAVTEAKAKVDEVQQQMKGADLQIAHALVEVDTEKQIARVGRIPKGGLVKTTAFIRYNGAASWSLSKAGVIETFFQQKFGRPLPIAVFGQGAIHNQWHLDHRNAMDVSLNPDGIEGQALMEFLRTSGIPFSAFRTAIPGVATGPHIHIGLPSHRY